jgi:AraC-like DNA-binding protein
MAGKSASILEWRQQYARHCLRVDFEPSSDAAFQASVKPIDPELRIIRASFSPGFVFRDDDLIRDGDDSIGFVVAQSGKLTARHLGCEVQLAPGDATMMLASATGGLGSRKNFEYSDIMISPAEWEARSVRPEDGLMQRLWGKSEAMRLLRGYLHSLERIGRAASVDNTITRGHIADLAALATTARCPIGESSASAVAAARQAAALNYIASHFSDPELRLSGVARSLDISPRYLQRLLEALGISFAAYVIELRLQRAVMLLTAEHEYRAARISDIAFQVGFSDISYFNRLFRSRFGRTPSDVRAEAHPHSGNIRLLHKR